MSKLFGMILVAAPLLAFSIWAYLHQTQLVETRMDTHEIRQQIDKDKFDREFSEALGKQPDPKINERIEAGEAKLEEAEKKKQEARKAFDDATIQVDEELRAYDQSN